jgi:hypothetical protein
MIFKLRGLKVQTLITHILLHIIILTYTNLYDKTQVAPKHVLVHDDKHSCPSHSGIDT